MGFSFKAIHSQLSSPQKACPRLDRGRGSRPQLLDSRFRGNDKLVLLLLFTLVTFCSCTTDSIQPTGSIRIAFQWSGKGAPSAKDSLFPVYPNPFNRGAGDTSLGIQFAMKDSGTATVLIQNFLGDAVAGFTDSLLAPGNYLGFWNPRASDGALLTSGLYFVTLHVGEFVTSRLVNIEENE
jgi:hypothetical protein